MNKRLLVLLLSSLLFTTLQAQTTAKDWYDKGLVMKKNENVPDAISAFKKAVALQANYPEALHQLGWCYNEAGQYADALDALKQEEKAGSMDKAGNNFEMGYSYEQLAKYDEALTCFNKAIDLDNDYPLAYKERGNSWYKKKE